MTDGAQVVGLALLLLAGCSTKINVDTRDEAGNCYRVYRGDGGYASVDQVTEKDCRARARDDVKP